MPDTTVILGTPQPHSVDAERTLLGALLLDPERLIDIAALLKPADFYDPTYGAIYAAMVRMHEDRRPVDFITVTDALKGYAPLEAIGGAAFVSTLVENVPTSSHALQYAELVRETALKRALGKIGVELQTLARDHRTDAETAVERGEQLLLALSRSSPLNRPQHIAEVGQESYERYAELYASTDKVGHFGLRTGFRRLDELITGLLPGSLIVVAARPSMGKSALALDIARHVAAAQAKSVAVFSLEMTKQEIMDRVIAGFLGVETWKLKKGQLTEEDFGRLGTLFDGLQQHPLFLDDDPDTTIANLRSKARRQQLERGLDLLIIDYLQLIEVTDRTAGENRTQQVSHISRNLKNLARELGCPIIALSQLSRNVEQRSPPIPVLSDLRDSGSIEQDADVVLMLYREEVYNEDAAPGGVDLYVRKNRNGPTGRIDLRFDKERMSFREPNAPPHELTHVRLP